MSSNAHMQTRWRRRIGFFLAFFVAESAVFAIITLSPYMSFAILLPIHAALTAVLFVPALFLRRSVWGRRYALVCAALFVAAVAVLLSTAYSDELLQLFGLSIDTPEGMALAKFCQSILRVVAILALMPIMGSSWRSLYLKLGRIDIWLLVGLVAWVLFPALAFLLLPIREGMLEKLLPLWPWILLFVLSNGLNEELLYRGVFLQKYEVFLGKGLANITAAVVFTLMHTQVSYAPEML